MRLIQGALAARRVTPAPRRVRIRGKGQGQTCISGVGQDCAALAKYCSCQIVVAPAERLC